MDPLRRFTHHAGGAGNLVQLDPEHPGFRDPVYRERRNTIARIALDYQSGESVPEAPYTEEEQAVWREVRRELLGVHEKLACREILTLQEVLPLEAGQIPQLARLNQQ